MKINMLDIIFVAVLASDIWYLVKACKSLSQENKTIAKIEKDVANLEFKCFRLDAELQKAEHQIEKLKNNCEKQRGEHTESDNKTQTLVKYAILHDCIDNLNG